MSYDVILKNLDAVINGPNKTDAIVAKALKATIQKYMETGQFIDPSALPSKFSVPLKQLQGKAQGGRNIGPMGSPQGPAWIDNPHRQPSPSSKEAKLPTLKKLVK